MSFTVWVVVGVVIFAVLAIIKLSNEKQKVAVRLLIIMFVFLAITVSYVGIKSGADLKSFDSIVGVGKVYFSWLGNIIDNTVSVTGYAIHQDWGINSTNVTKPGK